jgi:8-oxo-dGTP diphosphatase
MRIVKTEAALVGGLLPAALLAGSALAAPSERLSGKAGKPFRLAVKAVIVDAAGRCLLVRRSPVNHNFVGCWEWPGGKCDPGESFDQALVREVLEETGLTVEITGLAGVASFEMPAAHVILLCLDARISAGTLRLSLEHDASDWIPLAGMCRLDLPESVRGFMLEYAGRKAGSG